MPRTQEAKMVQQTKQQMVKVVVQATLRETEKAVQVSLYGWAKWGEHCIVEWLPKSLLTRQGDEVLIPAWKAHQIARQQHRGVEFYTAA